MHILFLTFWYPTSAEPYQGIFVKEHATSIKYAGANINVLAVNLKRGRGIFNKHYENFIDENGIPTHVITIESLFYKQIYALPFLLYRVILHYIKRNGIQINKYDIIHSNVIAPCGLIGYWLSKKYSLPHVITEHWSKIDKFMELNLYSATAKRAYANSKDITAVSNFLKKSIQKYVPEGKQIYVVPNVVNTNIFKYSPKKKNDKLRFTAVATWAPPKRPFLFSEALNVISLKITQPIELNLIGGGELIDSLKEASGKYNYKINFLGRLSKEAIAAILSETDFFLHASDIETFSAVVAEALCTGTPVIASNVGALPELITTHKNGILCNNTIQDWVNGIMESLDVSFDNQEISSEISPRVSLKEIGSKFMTIYNSIVA